MSVEALLGTDAVFADDLQRLRPQHGPGRLAAANLRAVLAGLPHRRQPQGTRVHPRAGRLLAALRAPGARRRSRHPRPRRARRRARARIRRRQPRAHAGRPRRVERQLPRRAGRLRARLPRDRRRRRRQHVGAPHRPVPRPGPQPGPHTVPRPRGRRRLGPDDRAVHRRRHRLRAEAARRARPRSTPSRRPRCRRTTSRWAGRPPASCAARSTASAACSPSRS